MSNKQKAIELRQAGYTYTDIAEKTGLAKSTLSYHLGTLPFTPNNATIKKLRLAQLKSAETKHDKKLQAISDAKHEAKKLLGQINDRDCLIAGIALYAGEGSKTQNLVRLVNTDVKIINFFIRWLEILGVPPAHLRLRVHAYPETDVAKAEHFWLQSSKLTIKQLQPACIDYRSRKDSKRAGTHPHGTAHVTVLALGQPAFGSALARKISALTELLLG